MSTFRHVRDGGGEGSVKSSEFRVLRTDYRWSLRDLGIINPRHATDYTSLVLTPSNSRDIQVISINSAVRLSVFIAFDKLNDSKSEINGWRETITVFKRFLLSRPSKCSFARLTSDCKLEEDKSRRSNIYQVYTKRHARSFEKQSCSITYTDTAKGNGIKSQSLLLLWKTNKTLQLDLAFSNRSLPLRALKVNGFSH